MNEILAGFVRLSGAEIIFLFGHLAPAVGLCLTAWVLGRSVTARLAFESAWESVGFSFALGLGLLAGVALLLGSAGLLTGAMWIAALAVIGVGGLVFVLRSGAIAASMKPSRLRLPAVLMGLVAFAFFAQLARVALYPPVAWDATMYHLAVAKVFATTHTVAPTPFLRFPVFPQLAEVLFGAMIGVQGDAGAHLVSYVSVLGTTLLVIAWARRLGAGRAMTWAAVLWLANPIVLWLGATGYVDATLTLFVTGGLFAFWLWCEKGEGRWLALSGVLTGFACGTKYSALFVGLCLGLAAIYWSVRHRRPGIALFFALMAAAGAGPWYGRVFIATGSPVFPFLSQWFGAGPFSAADVASLTEEMKTPGVPTTLWNFVRLPWLQAFDDSVFRKEAPLNPVYVVMMVLPLVGVAFRRLRWLVAFGFLYTAYWFLTFQQQRYLIPILPMGAVLGAHLVDRLLAKTPLEKFDGHAIARWGITTAGVVGVLIGLHVAVDRTREVYGPRTVNALFWGAARDLENGGWRGIERGPLPTTERDRDRFLMRRRTAYPAYARLNALRGTDYHLYALYNEENAMHADGLFMGDWLGPARYDSIVPASNARGLFEALRRLKADYFLSVTRKKHVALPRDSFFFQHFVPVYLRKDIALFALSEQPRRVGIGEQMLVDPGFEAGPSTGRAPGQRGWTTATPDALRLGGGAHGGRGSARLSPGVTVSQRLAVAAWTTYNVSAFVQGPTGAGLVMIVIFHDEAGTLLDRDEVHLPLIPKWRPVGWSITAPDGATTATLLLRGDGAVVDDARVSPLIVAPDR